MKDAHDYQLVLVMPVYNEQECVVDVVQGWRDELTRIGIDFLLLVINDGSRDLSGERLARFVEDPRVRVINKANSGHGPSILLGYRLACAQAQWVFQTDSDDEMSPAYFRDLWQRRHEYDALFGRRHNRIQGAGRRLISRVSRLTVGLLFRPGVKDVNTPYRLIRSPLLKTIVDLIPSDTFAPNLVISGGVAMSGGRIFNRPVPHQGRRTGSVSIVKWKLWRAACRSFIQTVKLSAVLGAADLRGASRAATAADADTGAVALTGGGDVA